MRKLVIFAAALGLFIPASMSFTDSAKAADETGDEEYFFVMNAASGSYDTDRLSLDKIPTVVFFTNRPARKAGHLSLDDFIRCGTAIWKKTATIRLTRDSRSPAKAAKTTRW